MCIRDSVRHVRQAEGGGLEQIHRSDEGGDEACRRLAIDLLRRTDLLDRAAIHHADPVGDGERFFLIVGDIDRGDADRALDVANLVAQVGPELGGEMG